MLSKWLGAGPGRLSPQSSVAASGSGQALSPHLRRGFLLAKQAADGVADPVEHHLPRLVAGARREEEAHQQAVDEVLERGAHGAKHVSSSITHAPRRLRTSRRLP